MKLLAIETSGATFSIALAEDNRLVSELFWHAGLTHSERLVPAIEELLRQAGWNIEELGKIAVSTGPGSFTGIRVGLTCARTVAQALDVPLVGIDTLSLIKAAIPDCGRLVCPAIDALRGEVFVRRPGRKEIVIRSVDDFCEDLRKTRKEVLVAGNAALQYAQELRKALRTKVALADTHLNYPRAGVLALTALPMKGTSYREVQPLYVRRSYAEERQKA